MIEVIDTESTEYRFAQHYIRLGKAQEAGRLIGLSPNQVKEIVKKPAVKAYINKIKEDIQSENFIQKHQWMSELSAIGFSRVTDVLKITGESEIELRSMEDIPDIAFPAIESISVTPGKFGKSIRVKFYNKMEALRIIGQALGFYEEPEKNVQNFFANITNHIKNQ